MNSGPPIHRKPSRGTPQSSKQLPQNRGHRVSFVSSIDDSASPPSPNKRRSVHIDEGDHQLDALTISASANVSSLLVVILSG
eukprot:CAMPEP_0201643802 /NCGR_PEP_ID=MMETSP0493-20130528/28879_1 /ASSEMBLY_ACC=CAM_ASM_000838 /TAXON_ID=420259 /ORGANISM="Thalassiosira gravida, Strain GMp14c1" /LENGTH=81 /DNA_ID=CAMNT_0048118309 /DNA_START=16 /DNA_END=264 /DNA_ORIENTATION=+